MESSVNTFLENDQLNYLYDYSDKTINQCSGLELNDFALFKVTEITYEDESPRKEAIENFLSTMRIKGFNLIFLLIGEKDKTSFYYGVAKDLTQSINQLSATDVGEKLLKTSITGNFRGSKVLLVEKSDKEKIAKKIQDLNNVCIIDGVPGINEDKENFQGMDRFVDTMQGDEYVLIITAKYLPNEKIGNIEKRVNRFYAEVYPSSKLSIQQSVNDSQTEVKSRTTGTNDSVSKAIGINSSDSNGASENVTTGESKTLTNGTSHSESTDDSSDGSSTSTADSKNFSKQTGSNSNHTKGSSTTDTKTEGTNESISTGSNVTKGSSETVSREHLNKNAQEWLKYLDDVLYKRIDYGKGKGLFITSISVCASDTLYLKKAQNTLTALFSGNSGNKVPLRNNIYLNPEKDIDIINNLKNFQVPKICFNNPINEFETYIRSSLSQYVTTKEGFLGNWLSVKELSLITCLPQKEVVGLKLKEQVEFGLNFISDISEEDVIELGKLIQSGQELNTSVKINKKDLDKHVFVTGVTGSGKTTTCQNLLIKSNYPFLVIEPAKTEYRALKKRKGFEDILIFTLGKDGVAPFRLNPLEFIKGESISSHVDMLKASIESAFDMEAAIPQIIEHAIYKSYEDCGWNISDSTNSIYGESAFEPGVNSFPTLSEMINNCACVVENQGFDQRLRDEYIGSINARLQGLIVGAKGQMLDCRRSISFSKLLQKKVVIELEEVRSGSEKALIMGFILANLQESLKQMFKMDPNFKHITLIEEAHRLLSKYEPGDALSKKNGVEMFADMLAEVRKYGESLIIADQIPSKLMPDVIKNTNTKIVHKIFAQDDKEAIGNTMALSNEQKQFLSSLNPGRTVVFTQGWDAAMQVQIEQLTNTTSKELIKDESIRETAVNFHILDYKSGVFPQLTCLEYTPSVDDFEKLINNRLFNKLDLLYPKFANKIIGKKKWDSDLLSVINGILDIITIDSLVNYIATRYYRDNEENVYKRRENIRTLLQTRESADVDFAVFDKILNLQIRGM